MLDREALTAALGAAVASRLARLLGLTPGSVTALVDRLIKADYARRTPDPTHGRRMLIVPTEHAARAVTELLRERLTGADAELPHFSDAELAAILRFLRSATERHERSAAQLRG